MAISGISASRDVIGHVTSDSRCAVSYRRSVSYSHTSVRLSVCPSVGGSSKAADRLNLEEDFDDDEDDPDMMSLDNSMMSSMGLHNSDRYRAGRHGDQSSPAGTGGNSLKTTHARK